MNNLPDYIIWRINESEEELRAQLQHPELYADKVATLKPGSRRMLEVLATRCAMKALFDEEKEVLYTPEGAPYLAEGPYISISHTQGYAAVISASCPVGIDIERLGKRVERVVSQFLKPEENICLQLAADRIELDNSFPWDAYTLMLHLAWSAKETAYKVLGHDYYDLRRRTSVIHFDATTQTMLLAVDDRKRPLRIHCEADKEFVMTYILAENSY